MERWEFYTVLANGGQSVSSSWTWRTVDQNGDVRRERGHHFLRLDLCVADAVAHGYLPQGEGDEAHPIAPVPLADGRS